MTRLFVVYVSDPQVPFTTNSTAAAAAAAAYQQSSVSLSSNSKYTTQSLIQLMFKDVDQLIYIKLVFTPEHFEIEL